MNPNTIIEEEKKKRFWCFVAYEKSDKVGEFLPVHSRVFDDFNEMKEYSALHSANRPCTIDGKPEYYSTYFDTSLSVKLLTTAMQRAYEVGKADSAQENTPDTEWGVKNFREGLEKVCKYADTNYCPGCGLTPEGFDHLLTSRDTYWKERVRKDVEDYFDIRLEDLVNEHLLNEDPHTETRIFEAKKNRDEILTITNEDNLK